MTPQLKKHPRQPLFFRMSPEMPGWDQGDQELYTLRSNFRKIYAAGFEVVRIKEFLPMQLIYFCKPAEYKEFFWVSLIREN